MAQINNIQNIASVVYEGETINSQPVNTLLQIAPTIEKEVDKLQAKIGDILTYTVTITNESLLLIENLTFLDTIADGAQYVENSFEVNGEPQTPTFNEGTLEYVIPQLESQGTVTITFQVEVIGGEI